MSFSNEGVSIGTVLSSGEVSSCYDFDHSRITTRQISSPLTSNDRYGLEETLFQELDQPDTFNAEFFRDCKIIFVLIDDIFANTKRGSKLKLIRHVAVRKKKWIDSLRNKYPQFCDIVQMLHKKSRRLENRGGARVQKRRTTKKTRLCRAIMAPVRKARGGKRH